ncbi:hypothetical protein CLF_110104 [Clonorchis sinensis]|uniref:Uncharacterized protein n=1 Tax=Clonorchis sinensis TaxID=79923 RepID=H2KSS5_CLOSI|nr:hypothetical protein CLF_110104 [Clonorchis sinensis]
MGTADGYRFTDIQLMVTVRKTAVIRPESAVLDALKAPLLHEGQYALTSRPPRNTRNRSTGIRCSLSGCSLVAFGTALRRQWQGFEEAAYNLVSGSVKKPQGCNQKALAVREIHWYQTSNERLTCRLTFQVLVRKVVQELQKYDNRLVNVPPTLGETSLVHALNGGRTFTSQPPSTVNRSTGIWSTTT